MCGIVLAITAGDTTLHASAASVGPFTSKISQKAGQEVIVSSFS